METLINSFDTGKRYLQVYKDGSSKIVKKAKTKAPKKLENHNYIDVIKKECGQATADKVKDLDVEIYSDVVAYEARKKELKIIEKELIKEDDVLVQTKI